MMTKIDAYRFKVFSELLRLSRLEDNVRSIEVVKHDD